MKKFIKKYALGIITILLTVLVIQICKYEDLKENYNACQSNVDEIRAEFNTKEK